jgi:hypothetical protein
MEDYFFKIMLCKVRGIRFACMEDHIENPSPVLDTTSCLVALICTYPLPFKATFHGFHFTDLLLPFLLLLMWFLRLLGTLFPFPVCQANGSVLIGSLQRKGANGKYLYTFRCALTKIGFHPQ